MTLQERCEKRRLLHGGRYFFYQGQAFDLSIALPDYARLRKAFTIRFDSYGEEPPEIYCGKHIYKLVPPLLTYDNGYPCLQGKYKGSKGLHKIPLHRIAYVAYYGTPQPGFHIHHINKNKLDFSAKNLVALTEDEHCEAHKRDVRVQRTLFTPKKRKNLLGR